MKPITRNILIVGGAVILVTVLAALYLFNKKHPDLSQVKPDYSLTATELYDAFNEDEIAANEKFKDKILDVTGNVAAIESSGDSIMNVILMDDDKFAGVICTFRKVEGVSNDPIPIGEIATIRGVCAGMLMDVLLNNCVFVRQKE